MCSHAFHRSCLRNIAITLLIGIIGLVLVLSLIRGSSLQPVLWLWFVLVIFIGLIGISRGWTKRDKLMRKKMRLAEIESGLKRYLDRLPNMKTEADAKEEEGRRKKLFFEQQVLKQEIYVLESRLGLQHSEKFL